MVGWSDIVRWSPDELETAYDAFHRNEAGVQAGGDQLYRSSSEIRNEGYSADSARSKLQSLRADSDKIEALISDLLSATKTAASGVDGIEKGVKEAKAEAAAERLTISASGTVSFQARVYTDARAELIARYPQAGATLPLEIADSYREAEKAKSSLTASIASLINEANQIDSSYTAALNAIAAGKASVAATAASAGSSQSGFDSAELFSLLKNADNINDVRGLWDSLSYEQQQALIKRYPIEIGAMDGVPFKDRFLANDLNIDREVGELNQDIRELERRKKELEDGPWRPGKYLEIRKLNKELENLREQADFYNSMKTTNGGGALLFDPDNNRIIEVKGDINAAADELITFVPGTNTTKMSLRNYSDLTAYLVEQGDARGKNAVAFNFYDGRFEKFGGDDKWISWFGGHSNASQNHMRELGGHLSEFQQALAMEDFGRHADNNVIGHSAGHSVVTASEVANRTNSKWADAHYDNVHSLSGSYAPDGWQRQYSTEYDHYAYSDDPIHILEVAGVGETRPLMDPTWENHVKPTIPNPLLGPLECSIPV